jgi:citrate synthase
MTEEAVHLARGLKDVYIDTTEASFIDGQRGVLVYRGYDIHDLAERSSFEEVIHLLLHGTLPTRGQLEGLDHSLKAERELPPDVYRMIESTKAAHPMDVLRTAASALAAWDPEVNDNSEAALVRKGLRITAKAATVVCAHDRIRNGRQPIAPSKTLSHAGNFLYMLHGQEPDPEEARILDVDFVLHAEHGANASAFAARVAASTLSDLHSAVVAGIGTLKGPWHGGAAEAVMRMAEDIGTPDRAAEYARKTLESDGRIMGFGHRVYKAEDPRARHLRERSRWLGERKGQPQWFQILEALHAAMRPYQQKGIFVNVDFYAGSIYYLLGIPEDLFVPIFALGRIPGWTLQVIEQYRNNILLRPLLKYVGPRDLEYVPIERRR